jgi:hypothetical protein
MAHVMSLMVNAAAQRVGAETTALRLNAAHLLMARNDVHDPRKRSAPAMRVGVALIVMVSALRLH